MTEKEKKPAAQHLAELKVQALKESFANKIAQYEEDLAEVRAQATIMAEQFNQQFNGVLEQVQIKEREIERLNGLLEERKTGDASSDDED